MAEKRLDVVMADRGLARSRTAAAALIRAGQVRLGDGGERALKPSQPVAEELAIAVEAERRFVSRGGEKLDAALDALGVEVGGKRCLDVGASTGGFTDCLLQRGAAGVVALDVGHGQLDWGLREDPRVEVIERQNARDVDPSAVGRVDLATIDVSFISLTKILGPVGRCVAEAGKMLAMVKPQFELGRGRAKAGVVRDLADRREAVERVVEAAGEEGFRLHGAAAAGVAGPKGNREVFILLGRGPGLDDPAAGAAVEAALR